MRGFRLRFETVYIFKTLTDTSPSQNRSGSKAVKTDDLRDIHSTFLKTKRHACGYPHPSIKGRQKKAMDKMSPALWLGVEPDSM
ncbi:uncharacterized protein BT62DRAFT_938741 [Guyanagaster necrorhizus]|uniref:Uncharacterized protein n=1 Tax=Guyanagaster necrorhizus TaxID=856835 RepID=A0A9P8AKY3_9AGAR|nr:uncharacterized protein BT62DRAFT_938741 [Guyanagaster necrorhizus MCA 3950]KAG7439668.1 hypothetical protein BT62DRAFT_938741 [Guyanagaster necrorhizus MCA 3950]